MEEARKIIVVSKETHQLTKEIKRKTGISLQRIVSNAVEMYNEKIDEEIANG